MNNVTTRIRRLLALAFAAMALGTAVQAAPASAASRIDDVTVTEANVVVHQNVKLHCPTGSVKSTGAILQSCTFQISVGGPFGDPEEADSADVVAHDETIDLTAGTRRDLDFATRIRDDHRFEPTENARVSLDATLHWSGGDDKGPQAGNTFGFIEILDNDRPRDRADMLRTCRRPCEISPDLLVARPHRRSPCLTRRAACARARRPAPRMPVPVGPQRTADAPAPQITEAPADTTATVVEPAETAREEGSAAPPSQSQSSAATRSGPESTSSGPTTPRTGTGPDTTTDYGFCASCDSGTASQLR